MGAALPPALTGLLSPRAYPHPADAVQLIETHISWVLLAGEYAYKIKRPVRYPFIDLREPARRRRLCEEELRLNRRPAVVHDPAHRQIELGGEAAVESQLLLTEAPPARADG